MSSNFLTLPRSGTFLLSSALLSSFAILSLAACSGDDTNPAAQESSHDAGSDAATIHADAAIGDSGSPPNPSGLGPAPVGLGSAADPAAPASYVILAKTGITNVTGSTISGGNLGLSPAAASFITGFSLVADPSNVYSTSSSVTAPAKLYASDYAKPTPMNLTVAVLAMQAAYSDAAGRSNPDHVNLENGNLGGLTLAPGLYSWGTGVTIPTDVTLSGGANDVWIFQISNDLDESSAKNVILAGGAQAKNVFWQVAGSVTIHANAHFEGVVLCQTAITLQTTASLNGRLFAQSLAALDNNAITSSN